MVRKATANDAEQLYVLNNEFNGEGETTVGNIRKSLISNQQEVVIVDDNNGMLTGFVCVQLKKSFCYDEYMPEITEDQLWDFYVRNNLCEGGYGKETAVIPLKYNPYVVGAFYQDKLVGIIRATFDGLTADIKEFCLECELQGESLKHNNG